MADVIAIVADGIPHVVGKYNDVAVGIATDVLADVIANVVDGITTYVMADGIAICGRWNSYILLDMADVVAIVADGIATWLECYQGRSYCLSGRWKSHWVILFQF